MIHAFSINDTSSGNEYQSAQSAAKGGRDVMLPPGSRQLPCAPFASAVIEFYCKERKEYAKGTKGKKGNYCGYVKI